jgi:hypothetical protein
MSTQSDMADDIYHRLDSGLVALAQLVSEVRQRWGTEHGVKAVHGFVREVATCLLWCGDVEVGDLKEGSFDPWQLEPEDADSRIDEELMSMGTFLEDQTRYVLRKIAKPNQPPEPTRFARGSS